MNEETFFCIENKIVSATHSTFGESTAHPIVDTFTPQMAEYEQYEQHVIAFYGHSPRHAYHQFSNFYSSKTPWRFELPVEMFQKGKDGGDNSLPRTADVFFAEKAIMLCKAALMKDAATFDEILRAKTPAECKKLGRRLAPFDQKLWDQHVQLVADAVVLQKFAADPALKTLLLGTGNAIIAECTRKDKIWGTGVDVDDPFSQYPKTWKGKNILGKALMNARKVLSLE